jgi:GNAT superfamily N-acetyltransferase
VRAIPRGESEAVQQADHADSTPGFASLQSAPEFHDQGCGRRLVRHAQELHGELTTDVNEQNPAARWFYEACGFVVEGRSEFDDAGRPFPLLHMRLAVPDPALHPTNGARRLSDGRSHRAGHVGRLRA